VRRGRGARLGETCAANFVFGQGYPAAEAGWGRCQSQLRVVTHSHPAFRIRGRGRGVGLALARLWGHDQVRREWELFWGAIAQEFGVGVIFREVRRVRR
jgi:hypothetical protein